MRNRAPARPPRAPARAARIACASFVCACVMGAGCSNPVDINTKRIQSTSYVDTDLDDPRFDTLQAVVDAQIRFEAVVDTSRVHFTRFSGSGLRIAIAGVMPDSTDTPPLRDLCSFPANYLDVPAIALPLRAVIPASSFRRFSGARLAVALVLLYRDANGNDRYDYGEDVYGAGEQHLFAWAEGKLTKIPAALFGEVRPGANKLVRYGGGPYPHFKATPDYASSIFIIYVRGKDYAYDIPYPWKIAAGKEGGNAL